MHRFCFWAIAISASLIVLHFIPLAYAAASAKGAYIHFIQKDPAGGGGGRGGGRGRSGGGFRGSRSFGDSAVFPRVTGPAFVGPGVAGPRFGLLQGPATIRPGIVPATPQVSARYGVQHPSGAIYPRYRYRHRGYPYYYGGWWYAYPWWINSGPYYYADDCEYWSNFCASQWGYDTGGYFSCMSYYGCD